MRLLRLISWQYVRKHLLRTVLTTASIVLGVALFVSMHAANAAVLGAFAQTVDRIAGKTHLQITAGETGFQEDILEKVQDAESVAVAVPVIEAVVDPKLLGQGNLLVLGVDMTGDRSLREYEFEGHEDDMIDDPLVFLAQPDSIVLSKEFADRNHLTRDDKLQLVTAEGPKTFTIRGLMKPAGIASAFNGNLAMMDIYAAQKMFGRGRTFDRIDLACKDEVKVADCQKELRGLLGAAFEVQPPSSRGAQFESMIAGYSMMMNVSSAFALFIGMFIIYNAFAIAVTQRRAEIGILRALGATQQQIRRLFLGESAALGLAGAVIGLGAGMLVARAASNWIGGLVANVYGVAQQSQEVAIEPWTIVLALAVGLLTSVIAAAVPARDAAQIDPVKALQRGASHSYSLSSQRQRIRVFAVCAVIAALSLLASRFRPVFYLGYLCALAAAIAIGPLLTHGLARLLRPVLRLVMPVEGALAADSLIQAPRRTSGTVIALMLSIALVTAFSGMALSSYRSVTDWMNTALDPDLFVLPSTDINVHTLRFPATMAAEIAKVPGVERVQMLRNTRITFGEGQVMVVALDLSNVAPASYLPAVSGKPDEMYPKTARGEGMIVSDTLAQRRGFTLGQTLTVPAPYGDVTLPIVGIVIDHSDQQGTIVVDRHVFIDHWHDDTVNAYRVYGAKGANLTAIRTELQKLYAGKQAFVQTNQQLKDYVMKVAGQWLSLTSVQIGVAVLVAILGIANMLTVSITDRRRELGVLRAVGALHQQVKGTIWMEAFTIAAIGAVLGTLLGAVNLYFVLDMVRRDLTGMRLAYELPGGTLMILIPVLLLASLAAAWWPSRSAVRGSLVEALEYE